MSFSEIELKRHEKAINAFLEKRRPPVHVRDKIDIACRMEGQSVEVFEIRPDWRDEAKKVEMSAAKATFVKSSNEWKIYWMRQDLNWHRYEPCPTVKSLDAFLAVIDQDEHCCFFG